LRRRAWRPLETYAEHVEATSRHASNRFAEPAGA
jgi:hypothetical protein